MFSLIKYHYRQMLINYPPSFNLKGGRMTKKWGDVGVTSPDLSSLIKSAMSAWWTKADGRYVFC